MFSQQPCIRPLSRLYNFGVRGSHCITPLGLLPSSSCTTPTFRPLHISSVLRSSSPAFFPRDTFSKRHIAPTPAETKVMLDTVGAKSLEEFSNRVIPKSILLDRPMELPGEKAYERGEKETLDEFYDMMKSNKLLTSFLGQGYYGTITPNVILRNMLECPRWYTPYTPYQAEVAQGRLEMLMNFQTVVADLTDFDVSNASLLDEATAAGEAMSMCFGACKGSRSVFLVSPDCHPQTIDVIRTRAKPLGVRVVVADPSTHDYSSNDVSGVCVQYPSTDGVVRDLSGLAEQVHQAGALLVCGTDLLALTTIKPPGAMGVDIAFGSAQRFGVPMGYGGPHAAFMATRTKYIRSMPGRIIGLTRDAHGKPCLRMALQTREQHIKRARATSNICTAQALLANMSAAYAIYHGPQGLRDIADAVHDRALILAEALESTSEPRVRVSEHAMFDTLRVDVGEGRAAEVVSACASQAGANIRLMDSDTVGISVDETTTRNQVVALLQAFGASKADAEAATGDQHPPPGGGSRTTRHTALHREVDYLNHPVFHKYQSEHEMMRYLTKLADQDFGLTNSMIPLGSCTMKLNSSTEMAPVTMPEVCSPHPFTPTEQLPGYQELFTRLEGMLSTITGFHSVSLQPNAGAQGEYSGLLAIKRYLERHGGIDRNVCIVPKSSHGTNPASAIMAGMKVVEVKTDKAGNIDLEHLNQMVEKHSDKLAALMVTYPSTHGVFEEAIVEVCDLIHQNGGQVYMDGANMNAQVGLTSPGKIGADVCHLNLHKTFCIPHGGGGPGVGAIGVAEHLTPHVPNHYVIPMGGADSLGPVCAAPWGSSSILPISHVYITLMGSKGLTKATQQAILAANYMKERLCEHYPILYQAPNGTVAHEFILDTRQFKKTAGIEAEDIAKRLMDYGFHAPTLSFPVANTLMIEPTESESLREIDRLIEALVMIRQEIREVEEGSADKKVNLLKCAPHTAKHVVSEDWDRPYTRERAAFPTPYQLDDKDWPTCGRIDGVYGDRNIVVKRSDVF